MERSSPKAKIIAVLALAGLLPWLISLAAFYSFGAVQHIQEPLHEFLELTGTCIALAVAALLLLRMRHEEELQHLFWAAAGLIAMGVVDGLHAVHGISIYSWQRHGATLAGGALFGLVWLPLPPAVTRWKGYFAFIVAGLALALGLWWGSGGMPVTWDPVGLYTLPVKAANVLGGLGFLSAALFFLRRYQFRPNPEDLVFGTLTVLFGVSGLFFGLAHTWAVDWWAWHGFRLLAYATVLIVGYKMIGILYRQIGEHAQKLEGLVQARTAELLESEKRFRIAAESLTDVVYDWDIKEKVNWYGDIDGIMGYPAGEFPRTIKGWSATLHPEDKERVMAALQGHLKGAAPYLVEYRVGRRDGEWRWWSARGTALRGERGEPYKMIGSISDITEHKRAEDALRETKEYLENLIGYANAPIIVWDMQHRITRFNRAFESLTGRCASGVLGQTLDILFPPDRVESSMELIRKAQSGERWETVDIGIRHIDGTVNTVLWNSATIFAPDGKTPVSVIAQGQDITERKRMEEALRESKDELQQLLKSMTTAFALFESVFADDGRFISYRFVYINKAYERITGVKNDEVKGKTMHEVWPDTEPEWIRRYGEVAVTGVPQTFDMYHEPTAKHYHCNVYRPGNTQERFCVVFEDITERNRTEEALRESEEKFKYIFDNSTIGKSLTFPSGEINVNKSFCDILGYSPQELKNIKWQDITPAEDVESTQGFLNTVISGEKDAVRFNKRYFHKNGSTVWADISTALRRDKQGKPLYFMTSMVDITERKRAEEDIRRLNSELEQRVAARTMQLGEINKELEAFCYSVSHDLRTPLRSIDGFSLALLEDYEAKLDAEGRAHLHRIRGSAQHMGFLIDDLLKLSRVSRAEFVRERVDLSALAQAVTNELRSAQPERDVECVIQGGLLADGDARLLRIALNNLLGNAWKFTGRQAKARVEVGAAGSGSETTFFVRDNGAGFDMKYAGKLFGAFQRLHKTEDFAGTGIGLATVQRVVVRHSGRVWAEAGPGKGATFFFTLGKIKEA